MAKALGKGLQALIRNYKDDQNHQDLIPIEKIVANSHQPRKYFDDKQLEKLTNSIKKNGILQPLTVRKIEEDKFELIAGERRLRSAKKAGILNVPVFIVSINNLAEMMEYALIENIQRVNLNPIEEAEGYLVLKEKYHFTQEKIAFSVSKSRSEIANKLRLLNLPDMIRKGLLNNEIYYGHARCLLSIQKQKLLIQTYKNIVKNKLSIRQTEHLVKSINHKKKKKKKISQFLKEEKLLSKKLGTKVIIELNKKKGKIKVNFSDKRELKKIIEKIN